MHADIYKRLAKKYNVEIKKFCKNKNGDAYIQVQDLEDGEHFNIEILFGDYPEKSFKRVFQY